MITCNSDYILKNKCIKYMILILEIMLSVDIKKIHGFYHPVDFKSNIESRFLEGLAK